MSKTYAVIGAGRQGRAAGYDLAKFQPQSRVRFYDRSEELAHRAAERVNELVGRKAASGAGLDVREQAAVIEALQGVNAVLSAVPYHLNVELARAAIQAGAGFCDLGGNTAVVEAELALDGLCKEQGVTLVPDCGLAPGMGNQLAAHLVERMPNPRHVSVRCGGLPQDPPPPLDYQLVFSVEGLINEYCGTARILRDGEIQEVPTLEEVEFLDLPEPLGRVEAFTTSGGTSTCPDTFQGLLETYDYKTIRYPGHCSRIRLLKELGFFEQEPVEIYDVEGKPRQVSGRRRPPSSPGPSTPHRCRTW